MDIRSATSQTQQTQENQENTTTAPYDLTKKNTALTEMEERARKWAEYNLSAKSRYQSIASSLKKFVINYNACMNQAKNQVTQSLQGYVGLESLAQASVYDDMCSVQAFDNLTSNEQSQLRGVVTRENASQYFDIKSSGVTRSTGNDSRTPPEFFSYEVKARERFSEAQNYETRAQTLQGRANRLNDFADCIENQNPALPPEFASVFNSKAVADHCEVIHPLMVGGASADNANTSDSVPSAIRNNVVLNTPYEIIPESLNQLYNLQTTPKKPSPQPATNTTRTPQNPPQASTPSQGGAQNVTQEEVQCVTDEITGDSYCLQD